MTGEVFVEHSLPRKNGSEHEIIRINEKFDKNFDGLKNSVLFRKLQNCDLVLFKSHVRCTYLSMVIFTEECPSISLKAFTSIPDSIH